MPNPPGAVPPELADTIFLLPNDSPSPAASDPFELELARQALWVAGREEFGLRVRDSSLGDIGSESLPTERLFRVRNVPLANISWEVTAGHPRNEHKFWEGPLVGCQYSIDPVRCLSAHEQMSRGFFAKCLTKAGLVARPNPVSDAPVPPVAGEALGEMRETAQVTALRLLHEEIRAKGESPALIAGLVRGYANLGLLTEFHWTSAHFVFKARALLYAQRQLARTPRSATALRLRAYAAALAGLHALALEDLASAAKQGGAGPGAAEPWVAAIDAYLRFDLDALAAVRMKADTPLVRLLQFLAVEAPEAQAASIRAGQALLTTDPECYRAHDTMCRVGGVSHLHGATLAGFNVFTEHLPARLGEMPDLPAPVRKAFENEAVEPGVYAALRNAAAADRGEPSWAALGGLLQEVRFTQAWHRLLFLADSLAVDTQDSAAGFVRLLDGHRLLPLIDSFQFDPRRDPEQVRRRLIAAPVRNIDTGALAYYFRLLKVDPEAAKQWFQRPAGHPLLYPEIARKARTVSPESTEHRSLYRRLLAASPHSPLGQTLAAIHGGPDVVARFAEVEAKYAGHAVVQWGLGQRYRADQRTGDAIRCWRRWVDLSPSGDAFRNLAELYREIGDEDRWRETLEACLKEPDTGLFHARVRVDLAEHYMRKNDFKRAEPYASAAAGSGAEWALLCAAECQEGLGNWDEANALYEAATDRYDHSAFAWYFACQSTGKMDRAAAERAVRGYVARFGPGTTAGELWRTVRFYLLAGDPKSARPLLERANRLGPSDLSLIFEALLADAAGDEKGRTAALGAFEQLPDEKARVRALGVALRDWSARGTVPDAAAVEAALKKLPPRFRGDGEFCFGWYLRNRNLEERSVALWKRCAASEGTLWVKTHARAGLESMSPKKD